MRKSTKNYEHNRNNKKDCNEPVKKEINRNKTYLKGKMVRIHKKEKARDI